jgi:hypothetical protein
MEIHVNGRPITLNDLANQFRASHFSGNAGVTASTPGVVYHVGHSLMGNMKNPAGEVYQAMGNAILKHKMKHNAWLPLEGALSVARRNLAIRVARNEMPSHTLTEDDLVQAYHRQLAYAQMAEAQWGGFPKSPKTIQAQPALQPTNTAPSSWLA